MSRAIHLVQLTVRNVGPLLGAVTLGPLAPGINVISGGNEAGKSTLVEALRMGLFERYSTKNRGIMSLQPHGTRLGPEVEIELRVDGEALRVHKRFIERPMVEVRLADGSTLRDRDADEHLLARLEGRPPKKSGLARQDMGVWGLLWVTQDESAYADPGGTLDEEVRGSLAEAVGRQVGKLTGGKHGERIRARVLEEVGLYFTPKRDQQTGEYRKAFERRRAADERVARIDAAVREVAELRERWTRASARLQEVERELPALRVERDAAQRQAQALERQRTRLDAARAQVRASEAACAARQREVDERAAMARQAAAMAVERERMERHLEEMQRVLADRVSEHEAARRATDNVDASLATLQEELDALGRRLARTVARADASRATEDLRRAEQIAAELAGVERDRAERALSEEAYERMQSLAQRIAVLEARLEGEGTRVVACSSGGARRSWTARPDALLDVLGLGTVDLRPARPGLARAAANAKEVRAFLKEALYGAGVEDVQRARERRAERAEAEGAAEALQGRIAELAPGGLERLAADAAAAAAHQRAAEERLDLAGRAQAGRERILTNLSRYPINARMIEALRAMAHQVEVARAAWNSVGTEVRVRSFDGVQVRFGDGQPEGFIAAGQSATWQIVKPTALLVGGSEITLIPHGEDLAKAAARLERAESELASALRACGVESLPRAEEVARERAEIEQARMTVEQRLAEAAPRGIDALRAEVERLRAEAQEADARLVAAREAAGQLAALEVVLSANRVTREVVDRILELAGTLAEREAEVSLCAARLRGVNGALAGRELVIIEPTRLDLPGEVAWEVIPGESGEAAELGRIERALAEALAGAGVEDLKVARARWLEGLALRERRSRLDEELGRLAPSGLEALRARRDALEAASLPVAGEETATPPAGALEGRIEALRQEIADFEARRAALRQEAAQCADARRAFEQQVSELRGACTGLSAQHEALTDQLALLRRVKADADLEEALSAARLEHAQAVEAADEAERELAAAAPMLYAGEEERAEGTLRAQEEAARKLRDEVVHLKTLLDRAAAEGRFEELEEARAEQTDAGEALLRMDRQARAARLLADVIEEAYADAQRQYLGPVISEAKPYLNNLRPGTEIQMTPDLRLHKVVRGGVQEDFEQLSGGTREQLSVIVRIALARVLARDRRPMPLILDDTLGWTDDARFLSMVKILRDAAKELQIILLTCHGSRFERLRPDYTVDLDELKRQAVAGVTGD